MATAPLRSYLDGNLLTWDRPAFGPIAIPFTGAAYRSPEGEVVWIDPPDPGADEAAILALGKPAHVFVTFRDHDRHVEPIAAKHGARVWVPMGQGGDIKKIDHLYHESTPLPAGLKAISLPAIGFGEHALIGEAYGQRFAFIGDAVFNFEHSRFPKLLQTLFFRQKRGPLCMKRDYRGGDTPRAKEQLRRLLKLNLDMLFLSHGEAIASDADRRLREVLGEA